MPRDPRGAYLWLRPAERDAAGAIIRESRWIIRDGRKQFSTGCGAGDRAEAEKRLHEHNTKKYEPERRERPLSKIKIADVVKIYLEDIAETKPDKGKYGERAVRLLAFFGDKTLDDITGKLCRQYAEARLGQGRSNKGKGGGAKRDLEDLRAAINHHAEEGLHRGSPKIVLPKKGKPRQHWLTRAEFARLLKVCWSTREMQKVNHDGDKEGARKLTVKHPLRHLCRFLVLGIYTGSRPGAVMTAAWDRGPGRSWIDLANGRFYRLAEGDIETDKRQPVVRLSPNLAGHLARWSRMDGGHGFVVTHDGMPVKSVKTALNRAVELAGLPDGVTAYTLRHSCASWLVAKGKPTRLVADFLGTSEDMIVKHYGHLAPDYQLEAALAIGRK
ncbi:integrase [Rhodoblastus acidophilus]|uniref:tyrosine-type recombinase/integrase n=1 Tax=Rhodoblastus acidophilus TaxID=1074 RepID=UPI002224BD14|nr:tyrosine-type recombinase/integrase [Rhodoblastus acidophilus]MCW2317265.1 integrase [Rhodoblastus acidophilus]